MWMLLGLIWAAFAPAFYTLIVGVVVSLLHHHFQWNISRLRTIVFGLVLAWTPVLAMYNVQRSHFTSEMQALKKEHFQTVSIPLESRLRLDSPTAGSFGTRYVLEGFTLEYQQYPTVQTLVQSRRLENGSIETTPIQISSARAVIREEFHSYDTYSVTTYSALYDGIVVRKEHLAHFNGSGLSYWILGAWGTHSYPASGSAAWSEVYYMGCTTFLKKSIQECMRPLN